MKNIKDVSSKIIIEKYESKLWINNQTKKIFLLDNLGYQSHLNVLSYTLIYRIIKIDKILHVINYVKNTYSLEEEDILHMANIFALYSSTDRLIKYINIFKNDNIDFLKKIDMKIGINDSYEIYSHCNCKNVNIFLSSVFGKKYSSIDYILNKYNLNFWDEFALSTENIWGSSYNRAFEIFNNTVPNYSLRLKYPKNITVGFISKFLKNKKLEILLSDLLVNNPDGVLYLKFIETCVTSNKLFSLKNFYNKKLYSIIDYELFRTTLDRLIRDLFDFKQDRNNFKNAGIISGLFNILLKFMEEYFTINELRSIFSERNFLTSVATFTNGHEIFKKINKYIDNYNYVDEFGYNLLFDAARYGSLKTFIYLEKKIDFSFTDLIEDVDNLHTLCFYNSNLDVIKYIFDKYKYHSIVFEDLDIDRCISNSYYNNKYNISSKSYRSDFVKKIKILASRVNIQKYIIYILDNNLTFKNILQLLEISEKSSEFPESNKNLISYRNTFVPYIIFTDDYFSEDVKFNTFKRIIDLNYKTPMDNLDFKMSSNGIIKSVLKYRCIHSKYIKYIIEKIGISHVIRNVTLFDKSSSYDLTTCPHKNYYDCMIDQFNILRSNLDIESYHNIKKTLDKNWYTVGDFNSNTYWCSMQNYENEHWLNKDLQKIYFLNCLPLKLDFLKNCDRVLFNSLRGWIILIKILRRKIRKIKRKTLEMHKIKFTPFLNDLEYSPNIDLDGINKSIGRKFKNEMLKNFNDNVNPNPQHIKPENLLSPDFDKFDYYLSEKADGLNKKIIPAHHKLIPPFPKKYAAKSINCEYIKELNIHFVYGLSDVFEDSYDFMNELREYHKFVEDDNGFDIYDTKESNCLNKLVNYMNEFNFKETAIFWFPKKIWKVKGQDVLHFLKDIWNKKFNIFPTDGWIINRSLNYIDPVDFEKFYLCLKIKPYEQLTLDLEFVKNETMRDADRNFYKVYCMENTEFLKGKVYRCYFNYERECWEPRELRTDKNKPNTSDIAKYLTNVHTKYNWDINDIFGIKQVDYYSKNTFENSKISKNYKILLNEVKGSILDLGCGYTPLKNGFKKYNLNYTGIDSDFNIYNLSKNKDVNVYWQDLNKDGKERWGNLYNYFTDFKDLQQVYEKKYDNIFLINTVHYFDLCNLVNIIKKISKTGTKIYIKYLCKELFLDRFDDFKGYIDNDDNYVLNLGNDEIKIYYNWTHDKPQIEKLISKSDIETNLKKIGFKQNKNTILTNTVPNYGNVWNEYMECFIFEEYECL